tara:strand:+ start:325 stop:2952 length:2628 start_codon:yes stop_codon:yes gene_type:complete
MNLFHFRYINRCAVYVFCFLALWTLKLEAVSQRVLFVGNSLTHRIREADLPSVVPGASVTIDPHFHTNCGQSLANTLENPTVTCAALKAPYTDGSIYDALTGEPWSAIVFQPFSGTAHSELEAIKTMIDIQRGAYPENRPEIYLYATWPGRPEAVADGFRTLWEQDSFSPENSFARDRKGLHWIYHRLKTDYPDWDVSYIGVGDMLAELEERIDAGTFSTLKNIRQIFADDIHHGNIGHWIAAQSMTTAILGMSPDDFNDSYHWYNNSDGGYGLKVLDLSSGERASIKSIISQILEMDPDEALPSFHPQLSLDASQFEMHIDLPYDQNLIVEESFDLNSWQAIEQITGSGATGVTGYRTEAPSAFFRFSKLISENVAYFQPVESKAPELRAEYVAADINHVIVAGQSNAVGYNAVHGDPITTTQPYDNLMFGPMLMWRYYSTSSEAASHKDSTVLDFDLWIGSGLRAPTDSVLTLKVGGDSVFWGPGGQATTAWQYENYRQTLQGVGFQSLHESLEQDKHAESFASTVCNALTRRTGARFFGSVSGIGGAAIYMLDARQRTTPESYPYRYTVDLSTFSPQLTGYYGTGAFAQTLAQVERAKQLADDQGLSYKVAAIVWVQGESDHSNTSYAGSFTAMVNYYNLCIKAITGQLEDVFVFTDSVTYNHSYAGQSGVLPIDEQFQVAHEDSGTKSNLGRVYSVGPRYPYNPSTHYAPQSVVAKGEVIAQVIERVLFRRRPWEPLSIKSVSAHESYLDCQFYVPVPPLQWSITLGNSTSEPVSDSFSSNYGFEVKSASGESILDSVALISPTRVRLTCTENPAGATLEYGNRVLGSGVLLRGNLSDSHDFPSLYTDAEGQHYDTRNWAMPFTLVIEEED